MNLHTQMVLNLAQGNSILGFYCQLEKILLFLGKPEKLPRLYDHVLHTLFAEINVNPVILHFELVYLMQFVTHLYHHALYVVNIFKTGNLSIATQLQ